MRQRTVKKIVLIFEDNTSEIAILPPGTGFYRERYTYETEIGGKKLEYKLYVNEVFWARRERYNGGSTEHGTTRSSEADEGSTVDS